MRKGEKSPTAKPDGGEAAKGSSKSKATPAGSLSSRPGKSAVAGKAPRPSAGPLAPLRTTVLPLKGPASAGLAPIALSSPASASSTTPDQTDRWRHFTASAMPAATSAASEIASEKTCSVTAHPRGVGSRTLQDLSSAVVFPSPRVRSDLGAHPPAPRVLLPDSAGKLFPTVSSNNTLHAHQPRGFPDAFRLTAAESYSSVESEAGESSATNPAQHDTHRDTQTRTAVENPWTVLGPRPDGFTTDGGAHGARDDTRSASVPIVFACADCVSPSGRSPGSSEHGAAGGRKAWRPAPSPLPNVHTLPRWSQPLESSEDKVGLKSLWSSARRVRSGLSSPTTVDGDTLSGFDPLGESLDPLSTHHSARLSGDGGGERDGDEPWKLTFDLLDIGDVTEADEAFDTGTPQLLESRKPDSFGVSHLRPAGVPVTTTTPDLQLLEPPKRHRSFHSAQSATGAASAPAAPGCAP